MSVYFIHFSSPALSAEDEVRRAPSPHISQFSPPLRSLFITRLICWRWWQDMRASSPDVSAYRLSPRKINRLHAGYRAECETSGLALQSRGRQTNHHLVGQRPHRERLQLLLRVERQLQHGGRAAGHRPALSLEALRIKAADTAGREVHLTSSGALRRN